jgi:hypothetical protein
MGILADGDGCLAGIANRKAREKTAQKRLTSSRTDYVEEGRGPELARRRIPLIQFT